MRVGRLIRGTSAPSPTSATVPARDDGSELFERLAQASARGRLLEREHATVVSLARILAERLVGQALAESDTALFHYAATIIDEARGARALSLHAHPGDATRLRTSLAFAERDVRVVADDSLAPGQLRVESELGSVEASPATSLARLAERARTALARDQEHEEQ
jgi:flagellar biosynthesis/type III secretory pathway protein FliH